MTENEWLASTDPAALLRYLNGGLSRAQRPSDRKLRLFAVACCRLCPDQPWRDALAVDRYEDSLHGLGLTAGQWAYNWAAPHITSVLAATRAALLRDLVGNPFRPVQIRGLGPCPNCFHLPCACQNHWERGPGAGWLAWHNGTVAHIAHGIYDDRAFDRLPILADALEEAGCDSTDLLAHLRSPGPHVRGCHVLDLLLGKD